MTGRLPAHIEVGALIRQVEALGGNAAVVARGDRDGGTILLSIAERGVALGVLERALGPSGTYDWRFREATDFDSSGGMDTVAARRRAVDPDVWILDLDVPRAQRFVAELVAAG